MAAPQSLLASLRESDPDRHAATLWLPAQVRPAVAALYVANAEIASVAAKVREPAAGEIRLQWWREVLEGEREHAGHPVAAAVLDAVRVHDLPRRALADLASAHVFDLYNDPMPDRGTLEAWCGETESVLFQFAALIAGGEPDRALADACGHAGCAYAIARESRLAGWRRAQGKCLLPADLLGAVGMTPGEFLGASWDGRHAAALEAFTALAREHLAKAADAISSLDAPVRPVFLPLATVEPQLKAAAAVGPLLFERAPEITPLARQWAIAKQALSGRIA